MRDLWLCISAFYIFRMQCVDIVFIDMIQKKLIDSIYKKFKRPPGSPDELDIPLLFERLPDDASIEIDGNSLIINSVDPTSPFHSIPIGHIHAILEFDEAIAIVLPNSILFISKEDGAVNVHIKDVGPSIFDRIKAFASGESY